MHTWRKSWITKKAQNPKIKCPQRCIAGDCVTTGQVTKIFIQKSPLPFSSGNSSELKSYFEERGLIDFLRL